MLNKYRKQTMLFSSIYIIIANLHLYHYLFILRDHNHWINLFFFSCTKDFWVFYGINTDLFQCGSELKSKMPFAIPWKFAAKINVREKKFELNFPPCKKEIDLFSVRYVWSMVILIFWKIPFHSLKR